MAILRGGKRIFGMDIRLGIPRDRSMDNINRDPRFKQRAGANPATTIGRYQSYVNEAEGFARKARFYCVFELPPGNFESNGGDFSGMVSGAELSKFSKEANIQRRVQAFVKEVSMPERTMKTVPVKHNGPPRHIVNDYEMGDVSMTFYTDKYLRERVFFEMWQKVAYSNMTHNFSYYDEYVAPINILQLGADPGAQERDQSTYGIRLWEAFPTKIGSVDYSAGESDVQTFTVDFKYRYWLNFAIDQQNKFHIGQSQFGMPIVKPGKMGLLSKLPPGLRRAGEQVLQNLKRSFPIGKITGGRVMPPFKFGPLNI
tara:strand:+ start:33 stop:971 length:939 start_codon:yes stop_codon:yes gene_type:complete